MTSPVIPSKAAFDAALNDGLAKKGMTMEQAAALFAGFQSSEARQYADVQKAPEGKPVSKFRKFMQKFGLGKKKYRI